LLPEVQKPVRACSTGPGSAAAHSASTGSPPRLIRACCPSVTPSSWHSRHRAFVLVRSATPLLLVLVALLVLLVLAELEKFVEEAQLLAWLSSSNRAFTPPAATTCVWHWKEDA